MTEVEGSTVIAVPLTSNVQTLKFPYSIVIEPTKTNGLSSLSIALCFQLRAVDKSRLSAKMGTLEKDKLAEIDAILRMMFDL